MDFFEAQARAKKRTSRLVILFAIAVAGTIAAGYFATVFALRETDAYQPHRSGRDTYQFLTSEPGATPSLWQPRILVLVSLGTLAVVGLASLYKWSQYSAGGRTVAESVGGRRVDPHSTD